MTRVLKQLWRNNVTVKLRKCIWGTDEAKLLGHFVQCGKGVQADDEKVQAIAAMERLPTIATLRSFLGSCVYLSRYIKDFAELTGSLYSLEATYKTPTTVITDEMWNEDCASSFKALKAALISAPVLAFPDFTRPFIIYVDTSRTQIGGALIQYDDEGNERVVAYMSKRLNATQMDYGITSKEGLGLIECCRKWKAYIQGHPTIVITDHRALTYLQSKEHFETDRLNRYAAELLDYGQIEVVHRPGRSCDLPDVLSRAEIADDPEVRHRMAQELLEWKAKRDLQMQYSVPNKVKQDDRVGEFDRDIEPQLWAESRALKALRGDPLAYDREELQRHMQMLVRGADVQGCGDDSVVSLKEKVEKVTQQLRDGTYVMQDKGSRHDATEADPRVIEGFDWACGGTPVSAVTGIAPWSPDGGAQLPTMAEIKAAQAVDADVQQLKKQMVAEPDSYLDYVIQDGMLKHAWTKGKGRYQETCYRTVVPAPLRHRIIWNVHCDFRNAHYSTAAVFAKMGERYHWKGMYNEIYAAM